MESDYKVEVIGAYGTHGLKTTMSLTKEEARGIAKLAQVTQLVYPRITIVDNEAEAAKVYEASEKAKRTRQSIFDYVAASESVVEMFPERLIFLLNRDGEPFVYCAKGSDIRVWTDKLLAKDPEADLYVEAKTRRGRK